MADDVKGCSPVPCPSFQDATLDVDRCPTCGSPELKWSRQQVMDCKDPFHDGGDAIALAESIGGDMRRMLQLGTGAPLELYLPQWLIDALSDAEKQHLSDSNYIIKTTWNDDQVAAASHDSAPRCLKCLAGDFYHDYGDVCALTHTPWKNCGEECCVETEV